MRVLIIRFSSFGDIFQALEAAKHLSNSGSATVIDWLVREDFSHLLENQPTVTNVLSFPRKSSVFSLISFVWKTAANYDHVYDAHSNLRSLVVRTVIRARWIVSRLLRPNSPSRKMILRSKERIRRFLFFKFRMKTLPVPYRGAESFIRPLRKWLPDLESEFRTPGWVAPQSIGEKSSIEVSNFRKWRFANQEASLIALAPSAAWPNKRWPVERWRLFVREWLESSPDSRFLLLGGPDDRFLDAIENEFGSDRVFNAVGKVSLLESSLLLSQSDAVVANDTGLLHVADRLQIPSVVIIGPTAFGYPVSPVSRVAEVPNSELPCKPCSKDGRDRCTNAVQLKCLLDVTPEHVARELREAFEATGESRVLT